MVDRLYDRREAMLATLQREYERARDARDERAEEADRHERRDLATEAQAQ